MAQGRPTLHHLNNSQSMRVLWLLEELKIDYDLKLYERYTSGPKKARAPDELKKIHPLGKSPTLVAADGRVIIESEAIIKYLLNTYDTTNRFHNNPASGNDVIQDDTLTSYASSSLNLVMTIESVFKVMVSQSPFFIRPLMKLVHGQVHSVFTGPDLDAAFNFLEGELKMDYFSASTDPGQADFMLQWPLDSCIQWKFLDLKKYPKLEAYYARCSAREGWKQARSKGNSYDLVLS